MPPSRFDSGPLPVPVDALGRERMSKSAKFYCTDCGKEVPAVQVPVCSLAGHAVEERR